MRIAMLTRLRDEQRMRRGMVISLRALLTYNPQR
jgi:hypothetical protein